MFGCLVPSISVYAVGDSWSSGQSYTYFENHFDDINTRLNGVIINQNQLRESFEDYLEEYRDNYNIPSGTSSNTWIGDNISGTYQNGSVGVSDLGFSQTFRQAMRDWCNAYIQTNTGYYYAYTWSTADYSLHFNDQNEFHAFISFVDEHDEDYHVLFNNMANLFILVPNDTFNGLIYYRTVNSIFYDCYIKKDWADVTNVTYNRYSYNSNSQTYIQNNDTSEWPAGFYFPLLKDIGINAPTDNMNWHEVNLNKVCYQVYKSLDALKNGSEGIQDYYVTDSYNSTISGSYNTTTSNIENTISSNNVNNYINNYYVENGEYPTPTQINIYINNYTGGSGGSGDGDDDDNNNNIWDFLDSIGDFLGHLISSLGEVLSGILSLLTDVIDLFIGENGLPNIFSQLVTYFLGFLPQEFLRLIELFVVCVLIVGIIKLIRGS